MRIKDLKVGKHYRLHTNDTATGAILLMEAASNSDRGKIYGRVVWFRDKSHLNLPWTLYSGDHLEELTEEEVTLYKLAV